MQKSKESRIRLPEPEEEPEPKGQPIPHPFAVQSIRVISASGQEKQINPRAWADYGLNSEERHDSRSTS